MDIRAFKTISQIVRSGSLTKAAEELFLTQSALSQSLSRIEQQLGTPLFERNRGKLVLTRAGEIFLREGEAISFAYDRMCSEIKTLSEPGSPNVRIGISGFYGSFFLAPLLGELSKKAPDIQVKVSEDISPLVRDLLLENMLDIAILPFESSNPDIRYEFLCREEIVLCVPKNSPALFHTVPGGEFPKLDLRHLSDYPFVMMKKGQLFTSFGYNLCATSGFTPRVIIEAFDWRSILRLCNNGLGVGFTPIELARSETHEVDNVVFCSIISPLPTVRSIAAAYRSGAGLTANAQQVVDILKDVSSRDDFIFSDRWKKPESMPEL